MQTARSPFVWTVLLLSLSTGTPGATHAREPESPSVFQDRTQDLGLGLSGSSACWVDVNNDGWTDLCCGGIVWRNDAGKKFTRIQDGVGEVVASDFDNDGFMDLFSWSTRKLFRNVAGEKFESFTLPELPATVSRGACWLDLNNDGWTDLYVGGFENWEKQITYPDFVLVSEKGAGFQLELLPITNRARGVTACDYDQDGDPDVYVSNYRLQSNLLWNNDGTGTLLEVAGSANAVATSAPFLGGHSIGAAWGDFDNDGWFDLFAGNFAHVDSRGDQPKSRFLRNTGPSSNWVFDDQGTCGVHYQESYASPGAADFDNDGDLDLFFTTVYATASFGRKNHAVLFRNEGDFVFTDVTVEAQLAHLPPTYQAAWADFDRDGDLDLVTANRLFVNQTAGRSWLAVRLVGDGDAVNRSAIGAQVRIRWSGGTSSRQVEAGTGEGNQNAIVLHFGLGDQTGPVDLDIAWPGKRVQRVTGIEVNRAVTISFPLSPLQP